MPIYEYHCKACDHDLETIQKLSDEPLKVCPECGQPELVKKISAAAFRLSGSGWYETDFKSGNKKNLAGDGAKSDTNNEGTAEAKPSSSGKAESSSSEKAKSTSSTDSKTSSPKSKAE